MLNSPGLKCWARSGQICIQDEIRVYVSNLFIAQTLLFAPTLPGPCPPFCPVAVQHFMPRPCPSVCHSLAPTLPQPCLPNLAPTLLLPRPCPNLAPTLLSVLPQPCPDLASVDYQVAFSPCFSQDSLQGEITQLARKSTLSSLSSVTCWCPDVAIIDTMECQCQASKI